MWAWTGSGGPARESWPCRSRGSAGDSPTSTTASMLIDRTGPVPSLRPGKGVTLRTGRSRWCTAGALRSGLGGPRGRVNGTAPVTSRLVPQNRRRSPRAAVEERLPRRAAGPGGRGPFGPPRVRGWIGRRCPLRLGGQGPVGAPLARARFRRRRRRVLPQGRETSRWPRRGAETRPNLPACPVVARRAGAGPLGAASIAQRSRVPILCRLLSGRRGAAMRRRPELVLGHRPRRGLAKGAPCTRGRELGRTGGPAIPGGLTPRARPPRAVEGLRARSLVCVGGVEAGRRTRQVRVSPAGGTARVALRRGAWDSLGLARRCTPPSPVAAGWGATGAGPCPTLKGTRPRETAV